MAPQTDIATVWDSYQNLVQTLRKNNLTEGITITSEYEDRQGYSYGTEWTINPLLLEGSGYFDYKISRTRCKPWRTRRRPWRRYPKTLKKRQTSAIKTKDWQKVLAA